MNSLSLTQVTIFVIAICLGSFFVNADVNADETFAQPSEEITEIYTEITDNAEVMRELEVSTDRFTFTSLDADRNGKLSEQEVLSGNNSWLAKAFNKIDYNADESITEQELVDFATNMATSITAME